MNKRFLYISILVWLIIGLAASFPAGNFFNNNSNNAQGRSSGRKSDVVSISTEHATVADDSPELPKNQNNKSRCKTKFLLNRSVDLSAIVTRAVELPGFIPAHIKQLYTKYFTRKASLPGYYGFLFRLCPF